MDATINGLADSVSVLEQNKDEHTSVTSDMLYNEQGTHFEGDFVYPSFDYQSMYMDGVSMLDEQTITN